jgi:two-component system, NarL family, nitrate/nitrite response regulator NarL
MMTFAHPELIRVFIIDDHPTVVWGLERLIESGQSRMRVAGKASSVKEALALLDDTPVDVIVLDIDLGGEDGAQAIPELIRLSGARILVLTGMRDRSIHEAAIRSGALGLLGKDADPADILLAIDKVARGELSVDRIISERMLASFAHAAASPCSAEEERMASLTTREHAIVRALMRAPERPLRDIASSLSISERTLRNHLSAVYEKLGVSGRLELYVFASRLTPKQLEP